MTADVPDLVPLPIDPYLPEVVSTLREHGVAVLEAPPGAGKTTRVPRALLRAGFAEAGEILVLQPRRLPTRLAAERVAEELGESVGHRVGYTVRFEDVASAATRLRFVTEGVLSRRLVADPHLHGIAAVVLDEFHERHLATDLGLGLLRDLRASHRPDLRLLVMSATLQADPISQFLNDAPMLKSEGRRFEVTVDYLDAPDSRPLADQVVGAVRRLLQEPRSPQSHLAGPALQGDVLVFLPGAGEIRRAAEALQTLASQHNLLVLPLHGDLPLQEQNRVVRPAAQRKVILSTNVAETSVTIDGVVAVIDSGLARVAGHSPWSGLSVLKLAPISQASAIQRAGRAGRTRPGRALRLYTRHDFETRRAYDLAEVARLDLSEAALSLHALGVKHPASWSWFESPPVAALSAAETLLQRLGAVDEEGGLTQTGRAMLRYPVHPRLARILVESGRLSVTHAAATLVAILAERDIRRRARVAFEGPSGRGGEESADVFEVLDLYDQAAADGFSAPRLRALDLEPRAVQAVKQAARQLGGRTAARGTEHAQLEQRDHALSRALLAGFVDRVGKRRAGAGSGEIVMAAGGSASIGPNPAGELLVVLDAQESDSGRGRGVVRVRLAAPVAADWLIDLAADQLQDEEMLTFNSQMERVERVSRLRYGALILDETRRAAPPSEQASRVLAEAATAAGGAAWGDVATAAALDVRLALLREHLPELAVPNDAVDVAGEVSGTAAMRALCDGRTSFEELRQADPVSARLASLPAAVQRGLTVEVPSKVRLPSGKEVPVHYQPDRPPWIESRLQDFFGLAQGPRICRGRLPLVLHLLAPNHRAVQVTRDLENFWRQHYPPLRKELGRRYPRHAWPEDGATAVPPEPRRPR